MAVAESYEVLLSGRIITGFGVGTGLAIAPLYMAELSPKRIRGALVSLNEVAINIGILLGFVAGYVFSGLDDNVSWRWMLGIGALPPLIILVSLLVMPESPRWLVKYGRSSEALLVLLKTCELSEALSTLEVLEEECRTTQYGSLRDIFRPDPTLRKLLIAGFGVSFFQQASGIEALVSAATAFKKQGAGMGQAGGKKGLANTGHLFLFVFLFCLFAPAGVLRTGGAGQGWRQARGHSAISQYGCGLCEGTWDNAEHMWKGTQKLLRYTTAHVVDMESEHVQSCM